VGKSLQESTAVTVEGESWNHGSCGHPAEIVQVERVEREAKASCERNSPSGETLSSCLSRGWTISLVGCHEHEVEREANKVNEREKKGIEYDHTDTLGGHLTTNKAGTSSEDAYYLLLPGDCSS